MLPAPGLKPRKVLAWIMAGVLVASIATWLASRSRLPDEIKLATALPGGQYHELGEKLAVGITRRTKRSVDVLATAGSVENLELLRQGRADLAIIQAGSGDLDDLAVLTPLHRDVLHVVVRNGRGIEGTADFVGRRVSIGPVGSGMRAAALDLLEHYRMTDAEVDITDDYFARLLEDDSLDGAVVVTGTQNPDLLEVFADGRFELLPIRDDDAIAHRHLFFEPATLPRGLYHERPPRPPDDLDTIATTALLVTKKDAPTELIEPVLQALFEDRLRERFPGLYSRSEAASWELTPLADSAKTYFDPYRGLSTIGDLAESLAATKELIVALIAGAYLLWSRWRSVQGRRQQQLLAHQMERLHRLLDEVVALERAQMDETDVEVLEQRLDEVTELKLTALEELTHSDLRGDRTFLIYLTECSDLIRKIQAKIATLRTVGR
ncbi:MAG: TAXI family TRAP transporter solute-binding subunit [Acidobacteriota bacterium]